MTKKTHMAAGLVVTTGVLMVAKEFNVACIIGIIGSTAPDWDFLFGAKHRGLSHSFIFALILGLILFPFSSIFALSFVLNYSLHIALDSFTVSKVRCYAPIDNKKYGLGLIKSGGEMDLFLCLALITVFGYMINLV